MVGKSAALRCLARIGLFAVVCALLLVPAVAGAADMVFPFMGAQNQATWAIQGFSVQWALFGGLSGSDGSPLYFLALTAVLVGAMLVVFNQKFQNFSTLGPWFVLVIVMIFAPYNSRLLFTPVSSGDCTGGAKVASVVDGKVTNVCGFTPQVVAMHVGNVISVLIYEVLKNKDMLGLIEDILARTAIVSDPIVQNIPPQAVAELATFKKSCPNVLNIGPKWWMSKKAGAPAGAAEGAWNTPINLFVENNGFFGPGTTGARHVAASRPAIVLYKAKPDAWTDRMAFGGGGGRIWDSYKNGLKVLYNAYSPTKAGQIVDADTGVAGEVPVAAAVDAITTAIRVGNPTVGDLAYHVSVAPDPNSTELTDDYLLQLRSNMAVGKNDMRADYFKGSGDESIGKLGHFAMLMKSNKDLMEMPVGWGQFFSESIPSEIRARDARLWESIGIFGYIPTIAAAHYLTSTLTADTEVKTAAVQYPMYSCMEYAHNVARSIFAQTLTEGAGTDAENSTCWNPLVNFIFDESTTELPNNAGTSEDPATKIYTCNGNGSNLARNVTNVINKDGVSKDSVINALLQPILASASMKASSGGNGLSDLAEQAYGQSARTGLSTLFGGASALTGSNAPSNGWSWLTDATATVGQAVAGAMGYLSGLQAAATVTVLKSLVEIAFVAILIVTPLMFLMGLLIPSNAMGMLITVVMGVLVLRLVPATLTIIDAVVGMVMQGAIAASGGGFDQFYTTGIILYAAAGMYTGVIGLTMLLMFKLGSADNFTKLQQLDNAADQIASAGTKVVSALLTTAGAIGLSGALGAAKGAISKDSKGKWDGAKEFMAESAVQTLGKVNSRMSQAAGGAVTDAMTPPHGVKKEDWDKLSAEEKLKHKGIYESKPAGVSDGDWDKMSMAQREEQFKKLSESEQAAVVAKQAGKAAYMEEERKKAEDAAAGKGDKEKEQSIADHMVKAEADWATADQDKYVNKAKETAAKDIRAGATALAEGKYGPMSGFGKKLGGLGGLVDGTMATMSGAAWGGLSGLRGGWEAFGEISAIPGAKVVSEILNEGKQAPQRAAAARAMAAKANGGKALGAFKTLGLPLVYGGMRGEMESAAAKQKYFDQEVGVWGSGIAAKGTNKMQSVYSAVTKGGEAQATGNAFAMSGLGNVTTAQAALRASVSANEKMASEAANLKWLQELDRHLNDTIGRGIGKLASAAGAEKGRSAAFDTVKGSYLNEAKSRAFRDVFGIKSVGGELSIDDSAAEIFEAVKDVKKKGVLRKTALVRARATSAMPGADDVEMDVLKSVATDGARHARSQSFTFNDVKIGDGLSGTFTNPRELLMGYVEGAGRRIKATQDIDLGKLTGAMDMFNKCMVQVGKSNKVNDDWFSVTKNAAGNKKHIGMKMDNFEKLVSDAFDMMRSHISKQGLTDYQEAQRVLETQIRSQLEGSRKSLADNGETHGLMALDTRVIKNK